MSDNKQMMKHLIELWEGAQTPGEEKTPAAQDIEIAEKEEGRRNSLVRRPLIVPLVGIEPTTY
jgi:hypothetical protein